MELYEIRYFLGVAKTENIHKASEKLNVSTGSLSKAIGRLESELGTPLFLRERRNIRLTSAGRLLQKRGAEIVRLEESMRQEISIHPGSQQVLIAGPEFLLAKMGASICAQIKKTLPKAIFDLQIATEEQSLLRLDHGEIHLALITGDVPAKPEFKSHTLREVQFQTFVGLTHPLSVAAKSKKIVPVAEVLSHGFVSTESPILGKVGSRQSPDGWRDDQFPRRFDYLTSSLKTLEEIVVSGAAIGYFPDFFGEDLPLIKLKISGCPYQCLQKVKIVAKNPKDTGWLNQIF